jgi:hypothetical protein
MARPLILSLLDYEKALLNDFKAVFPEETLPPPYAEDCIPSVFTHGHWYLKLTMSFTALLDPVWKSHYNGDADKLGRLFLNRLRHEDDTRFKTILRVEQLLQDNLAVGEIVLGSILNDTFLQLIPQVEDGAHLMQIAQMLCLVDISRVKTTQIEIQELLTAIDNKLKELAAPRPQANSSQLDESAHAENNSKSSSYDPRKELLWSAAIPGLKQSFNYYQVTAAYRIWSLVKTCSLIRRRKPEHVSMLREALESAGFYEQHESFGDLYASTGSMPGQNGSPVRFYLHT